MYNALLGVCFMPVIIGCIALIIDIGVGVYEVFKAKDKS